MFQKLLAHKYKIILGFILIVGVVIYVETRDATMLERFRRSDDQIKPPIEFSVEGLKDLHISGSNRVSQSALKSELSKIDMPVYVFDLQLESHLFIRGLPEHWYGYKHQQQELSDSLKGVRLKHILRRYFQTGKVIHTQADLQTEKQIVEELGFHYIQTNQTRHRVPEGDQVDLFIKTIKELPDNAWVHFHCSAGQGRTSVAMVVTDILKNGKKVALEDIVKRHHALGSEDLFDTVVWENGTYSQEMLDNRKNFIMSFYEYVNDPKGLDTTSWQEWSKRKSGQTFSIGDF